MAAHYTWQGGDLILRCHLQPQAAQDAIVGIHGDRLKVRITAPPLDGKANQHLIQWLSTLFDVPKRDIEIVQGAFGRHKTLRIKQPKQILQETEIEPQPRATRR